VTALGVDPIDAEPRCVHDMLIVNGRPTCSLCLGLPDVPNLDIYNEPGVDAPPRRLRYLPSDLRTSCTACDDPIRVNQLAAWSPTLGGVVCVDCEDQG
jgi:hypothetical protein